MKNRKIFAICVCFVIVLSTLFGCNKKIYITTGLKQDEIFKLSGEPCRLAEVLLVLMTEKSRYEKDLGKDIWSYRVDDESKNLEEEIKSKVKSQMAELKTVELLAKNNKIQLSDTEKEKIASASKEFINLLSDETKKKLSLKENDVNSLYTSFYMADKVYDKLTGNVKPEVSDEEARVIQIRYLYISPQLLTLITFSFSILLEALFLKKRAVLTALLTYINLYITIYILLYCVIIF